MKNRSLLLVAIILLGACGHSNCGGSWSNASSKSETKTDPKIEKIKQEMSVYLKHVAYATRIARPELEKHLQSLISKDTQDPKVFPLLNAFMEDEMNQENDKLLAELKSTVKTLMDNHIESRCKEMKLT